VAPAVREIVGRERGRRAAGAPSERAPAVAPASAGNVGSEGQRALAAIHDHLRQELAQLRDVLAQVAAGRTSAAEARSYLARMTIRQNHWTLGAFCAAYCRVVSVHHAIEDEHLFPDLRAADQSLGPVLERLRHEHEGIAELLEDVDAALVAMIEDERRLDRTQDAVDRLTDVLLAHLRYEEDQLLEPIGRLSIRV
jgi:hemerythrin-like domain-containing protein